mgnify:CR=1 FL=1
MIVHGMGIQLFSGSKIDINKFVPPKNINYFNKPLGGLWTSTYNSDSEFKSDWIRWCADNMPHWIKKTARIISVDDSANIFEIDNECDLYYLYREYSFNYGHVCMFDYLDYTKISNDFDAIHLTYMGEYYTRYCEPVNLYGWDCESTLWLNINKIKDIGCIDIEYGSIDNNTNTQSIKIYS